MKLDVATLLCVAVLLGLQAPVSARAATVQTPATVPLPAPKPPKATSQAGRPCRIGTFTGVMLPGSTVCMKVGGFVRAQSGTGGSARP